MPSSPSVIRSQLAPMLQRTLVEPPAVIATRLTGSPVIRSILQAGQGPAGPPGQNGDSLNIFELGFSYGDATPVLIGTALAGHRVAVARLDIYTAFDGTGASLSVGSLAQPELYMPRDFNDPTQTISFETEPIVPMDGVSIYLFIIPGSSANTGRGHVYIRTQL